MTAASDTQTRIDRALIFAAAMTDPPVAFRDDHTRALEILNELRPHATAPDPAAAHLLHAIDNYPNWLADPEVGPRVRAALARDRLKHHLRGVLKERLISERRALVGLGLPLDLNGRNSACRKTT